jgi:hypothetical protein
VYLAIHETEWDKIIILAQHSGNSCMKLLIVYVIVYLHSQILKNSFVNRTTDVLFVSLVWTIPYEYPKGPKESYSVLFFSGNCKITPPPTNTNPRPIQRLFILLFTHVLTAYTNTKPTTEIMSCSVPLVCIYRVTSNNLSCKDGEGWTSFNPSDRQK